MSACRKQITFIKYKQMKAANNITHMTYYEDITLLK